MYFGTSRIESALNGPIVGDTFASSLPLPPNGQLGCKESPLDEYDIANFPEESRQSQSTAGCFLELLK
jgi:hypothetical protein